MQLDLSMSVCILGSHGNQGAMYLKLNGCFVFCKLQYGVMVSVELQENFVDSDAEIKNWDPFPICVE